MKNKFTVNGWQVLSTAGIKRRGITEVKQIRQAIAAANLVDDKDYHILRHARYANSYYFTASASLQVIKHLKASPVSEAAPPPQSLSGILRDAAACAARLESRKSELAALLNSALLMLGGDSHATA
ncbi:hypothetical protein [Geobacter sp. SVR]|uniref:hypothetical protein n=1 Tax=Geobacter sp. SVR TaxID=2495594 RepID=UPI001565B16A|nr:hypothetical protein [Geobacter sp. SVR]